MAIEVKDLMGRVAIAVMQDAPFADIVAAMKRFAVSAVTVIDAERRPVGVVTADDLLMKETDPVRHSVSIYESRRQRAEHAKAAAVTAAQLMTSPAITVAPRDPVRSAARLMHDKHIKQLPVVDPDTGRIVGTLHQRDVLRVFTRPVEELAAEVRAVLSEHGTYTVEIDRGVVRISGEAERRSQVIALVERVRAVEGVIDVVADVRCGRDDLVAVPPLL
ncbi:inosine 5'-monophosphate dehydrogenase [Nonomuraea coxensis DSM 45129]|uniref:Inosine 5'-monophosphate dehydrogenase n=1 Tax=Nonomuraea coxensis DSM 45129 TaxID=1122611 RepID=A0ABX8U7M9_9ACTN|nr:CBS domain-containing protein [Nonomuraea coxensis]QYC43436.1 inosine 5'-monophosphate dehydrogenase [Nonomuraea coxensis DSM 45129]